MNDRRSALRWRIGCKAMIKLAGEESLANCVISDINFKGLNIICSFKLQLDSFQKLDICLCEDCVLADTEVWISWHKCIGDQNIYGLYFNKLRDRDKEKLYNFIRDKFPSVLNNQWWQDKKGGVKMDDNRIFERFSTKLPVRFLNLTENREGDAVAQDISAKGVGFLSKDELIPHTDLEMWLDIPDRGEPLYVRGEVVWSKPYGQQGYRTGVNLEKANLMGLSRVLRLA